MQDIRIGTAQFEARDRDPAYNLGRIRELTGRAAAQGAQIVCFHECCIPGYTWLQPLTHAELCDVAEPVPDGPSVQALRKIAAESGVVVIAGLVERDAERRCYNTAVVVGPQGFVARHRKLHTFVNPHLTPGSEFTRFDLFGCKFGMLICYDNNLPENVRITTMLGAEVIFMPHVTCGVPSTMPGRGVIDRKLWENRQRDPVRLRQEFRGPKGREWLLRWLPTRCWENGIYAVFSNPVGLDYDTVKPGLAMIVDPFGEVVVESHALEDDVVVGLLTPEKLEQASGRRYIMARRPDLYGKLVEPQISVTLPGWRMAHETRDRDAATAEFAPQDEESPVR